jgi:hypothetical protein
MAYVCSGYVCDCGCGERITVLRLEENRQYNTIGTEILERKCSRGTIRRYSINQLPQLDHWIEESLPER